MKRKTLLVIMLALCLCVALVSCGGGDTADDSTPHTHAYSEWQETKAPTCTVNGEKELKCSCGDVLTEEIKATGHTYVDGYCSMCGENELISKGLSYTLDGICYTVVGIGTCTDTELYIPSAYEDLPVTRIGTCAFYGCDSLTSVTFEEGSQLTSIGDSAFYDCDSLTSIEIPNSVSSIGYGAFFDCNMLTIYCETTEKPSGWSDTWNSSNCPVVWGYVSEE